MVEASACTKGWKRRSICSGVIPIPVSRTRKTAVPVSPGAPSQRASTRTVPRSVNLTAFATRLRSTCRSRTRSASTHPGSGATAESSATSLRSASGRTVSATSRTSTATSNGSGDSSMRPASILERSSSSSISRSSS